MRVKKSLAQHGGKEMDYGVRTRGPLAVREQNDGGGCSGHGVKS